jgi:hypothetical protein
MTWTSLHVRVRNDGSPPHKIVDDESKFTSREEALMHLFSLVLSDDDELDEKEKVLIENHLSLGGAYWNWEWRRKGNGDYYQVVENCTFNFVLNLDYNFAQDLEDLQK